MENFDFINKLLDGRVVFGQKEMISDNVGIIPVYSTKIQFFNIKIILEMEEVEAYQLNLFVLLK